MNVAAQAPCGAERSPSARPHSMKITPEIIGLQTYRYGPLTTKRRGGSHGASVPRPSIQKGRSDAVKRARPMAAIAAPTTSPVRPANAFGDVHTSPAARAIHSGTTTTAVTGRITTDRTWRRMQSTRIA